MDRYINERVFYFCLGLCGIFGLGYVASGIGMVFYGLWFSFPLPIIGILILVCVWLAYKRNPVAAIFLIILHVGNPITMISAYLIYRYLKKAGGPIGTRTRPKHPRYHPNPQQKIMDERDEAKTLQKMDITSEHASAEANSKRCKECGHVVSINSRICPHCGDRLD